jgi:glucose-6-phosphate 1-epimerase
VRNRPWRVSKTQLLDNGNISLSLAFEFNDKTRAIWPQEAELSLHFEIGEQLSLTLKTRNLDQKNTIAITQGLHSYFKVGDVRQVQVMGLEDHLYQDKVGEPADRTQQGPIEFRGEVNRIYLDVQQPLLIRDPSLDRRIHIQASGSQSAVVWNPWAATAKAMDDLLDDDYLRMVCVETTNAGPDIIQLAPGASHSLKASYSILDL